VRKESSVPEKFLKHLTDTDGLYEMRVTAGSSILYLLVFDFQLHTLKILI